MAPLLNSDRAAGAAALGHPAADDARARSGCRRVSDFMPIKHIVDAIRAVFVGDFGEPIRLGHDLERRDLRGRLMIVGTRTFRKENA